MKRRILVKVEGGVPYVYLEEDAELLIIDYDTDGVDEDEIVDDLDGERCFIRRDASFRPRLISRTFQFFAMEEPSGAN